MITEVIVVKTEIPKLTRLEKKEITLKNKKGVKAEATNCFYCEIPLTKRTTTVDHVIPKAKGGSNKKNNLVAACRTCNCLKSSRQTFLMIKWREPVFGVKHSEIIKMCNYKEKLDLFQTVSAYLSLDKPEKAYQVMVEFMKTRTENTKQDIEFTKQLKNYRKADPSVTKNLLGRVSNILEAVERNIQQYEPFMEKCDFQYLINGEIYSEVPYFNLALL